MIEVKDDMKWTSENMKWYGDGNWKVGYVSGLKLGKREKNSKNPDIAHHNWSPATLRLELKTTIGPDERGRLHYYTVTIHNKMWPWSEKIWWHTGHLRSPLKNDRLFEFFFNCVLIPLASPASDYWGGHQICSKLLSQRSYSRPHYSCVVLLSSDVRSEGSIAIVKKFDFDFFMIFGSTSLPQSKNVFYKKCLCVCPSVCLSVRRRSWSLN